MAQSQQREQAREVEPRDDRGAGSPQGCYVYGIFPGDIKLNSDLTGVGDPPGQLKIVREDHLAALVSSVALDGPLGTPADLEAHMQILDACAAEVPVLPMRFGAVLQDEAAVATELLEANHDEFAAALRELDDRVQYVVKGRYVEQTILPEVLAGNSEAQRVSRQIKGADETATRDARIKLGEMINQAIEAKREHDTRLLGKRMEGRCVASAVREPSHELDAVHVAFLLQRRQEKELQQVVEDLAAEWADRVEVRVLGPMAAYDFVVTAERS